MDFPVALIEETESVAAELHTNRSGLIRLAVETYLDRRRQAQLEQDLMVGYIANAAQASQAAEGLAGAEADFV